MEVLPDARPSSGIDAAIDACLAGVTPRGECFVELVDLQSSDPARPIRLRLARRASSGSWVYRWGNTVPFMLARVWLDDGEATSCVLDGLGYEFVHHNWGDVATWETRGTRYVLQLGSDEGSRYHGVLLAESVESGEARFEGLRMEPGRIECILPRESR
jgi:hypothetical protein